MISSLEIEDCVYDVGAFFLLDDESMAGECMWVPASRPTQIWPDEETKKKYQPITKDGLAFTGSAN